MDAPLFCVFGRREIVDRLSEKVENSAESLVTYGYGDARTGVYRIHASGHTVSRGHSYASYHVVTDLAGNLTYDLLTLVLDFDSTEKIRKAARLKSDVEYGSDNLYYLADVFFHLLISFRNIPAQHSHGELRGYRKKRKNNN